MLCANVQPHNGHHSPLRLYCSCDQTMVMILPTGGIFNWDTAEKIKTKGFLLQSPLSPFHVYNQFDFQNKVINFTTYMVTIVPSLRISIYFVHQVNQSELQSSMFSTNNLALCHKRLTRKSCLECEEVRSHGDASGSVSFKVSRWLSRDLILSFSVTCCLVPW